MNITEFLLARIAEDEGVARDAHYDRQRWVPEEEAVVAADRDLDPVLFLDRKRDATHAANWSPARVLAEREAKRRIVEHHTPASATRHPGYDCAWCRMHWPCFDVRALAAVYADHPDYDEGWRL